jgi:pteridine reductase
VSTSTPAQIALVTGAGKRIGRAVALALARAGWDVAVHYQSSADDAAALADEIRAMGRRAWTFPADLAQPEETLRLAARVIDSAGPIDALVNNASIYPEDRLLEMSEESLLSNVRVNAWAPFLLTRAVAAQSRAVGVVNFLDTRMRDYDARHVSYHLSKRMLFALTRMTAIEFAPLVRVNAIAPGLVLPPPGKDESYLKDLAPTNPLNAYGTVEDLERATLFLLQSSFITGQVIYVDGGRHMLGGLYD